MTDVDDEARGLLEAAETASAAATELLAQLDVLETFVAEAKRAEREGPRSRGVEALLWQVDLQIEAVRHVVKRFGELHKKVPGTVADLKAKEPTLRAVMKGLRRHKATFGQADLFHGGVEFQFSALKRYMRRVVPDDRPEREEMEFALKSAQDAIGAMKAGVTAVMDGTGW